MKAAIAICLLVLTGTAHASIDAWQLGLQLTSDNDTQLARIGGGVRLGAWKLALVVDAQPLADGSDDVDAIVEFRPGADTWGLLAGLRTCAIAIERGRQWQEQLLIGATGGLPSLLDDRIQPSFGLEMSVTIVRHGDELETDWISFESQRHVRDTISASVFLRFDYVSTL